MFKSAQPGSQSSMFLPSFVNTILLEPENWVFIGQEVLNSKRNYKRHLKQNKIYYIIGAVDV